MKPGALWSILLLSLFCNISAQDGYSVKQDSLKSGILGQTRKLNIFLPDGYDAPGAKFPVIYVLDADGRDQHTVPTARFLFINNKMPKVILVGIFNVDRNHDFLPDSSQNAPTGGGAANFLNFFNNELIPYINTQYKTDSFKVLIGHSYGGLFAMYSLLKDPDLFDAYIAIDPSFWYKDQMMIKFAREDFLKQSNWKKIIFISGREGGGMKDMGITPMEKFLKNSAPVDLDWKIVAYPNEDHGSVPFKSVYDGLRYVFDTGGNFQLFPQTATIPKGVPAFAIIQNNNPNLRYTTDGSEPTIKSKKCSDKIIINGPCTLKVKSLARKNFNPPSVTLVYKEGDYMNGIQSVDKLQQGLKYSLYDGVWDSVPDLSAIKPVKTGKTDNLDLQFVTKKDSFAVKFEGYLHITKKDLYYIWDVSDDGSKVYLNKQLFLNNDGLHSADMPVVKLVPLNPGYYPLTIEYFEKTGGEAISIGYVTGTKKINPVPFPKEMFFFAE
jgi:predicted alpha/beta superfamily hydrolase